MQPEVVDLDAQATTALAPEALAAMLPWLESRHWNPHSAHRGGRQAKAALEAARVQVAALLGAAPEGLIFTSGATEANNLALKGVLAEAEGPRRRLVTFVTEHSCVLETARHLERLGVPVSILPVRADGLPDLAQVAEALGPDVALLSAMRVNNEIGAIWPTARLAALARKAGALFHCDAAQGFGKIDCRLGSGLEADLVSLSGHKMHGPKGIGALWVRPGLRLAALLDGGGQEGGLRSGTQSPALAAGFGAAAVLAAGRMDADHDRLKAMMPIALSRLHAVPHRINGPDPEGAERWPGNLSVTFPGVDAGRVIAALPGIALSSGAACSSGAGRPSHVLAALGLEPAAVRQTVRLGWTARMSEDELEMALDALVAAVRRLGGAR
ncbi:cysteine desulfurase family protein [Sandaracinobacteroides sp. A072]|uniref:cysteine desulfurase family protein n=1 Tax=Sandaracinobacteroides sp. A072 TaxID=3461146 RepID=UPI0040410C84